MKREGFENSNFFVGKEVENTKMKGNKTLFVIGFINPKKIREKAKENNCTHIYVGANKSITLYTMEVYELCSDLLQDFRVTLDIPISEIDFIPYSLRYNTNFYLNASIEAPNIMTFKNITFKLDDVDFSKTNPGLWVFSLDDLSNSCYNEWNVYSEDKNV